MLFKIVLDEVFKVAPKDVNFSKIFVDHYFFFFGVNVLFTNANLSSFDISKNHSPPVVGSPFWLPDFKSSSSQVELYCHSATCVDI